jgi:hypothetical protein
LLVPIRWIVCLASSAALCLQLHAQVTAAAGIAPVHVTENIQAIPRVPGVSTLLDGFNAGVTYSSIHSSSVGWYSVVTPAVSYTFSERFSADASTSIYINRPIENTNPATKAAQPLVTDGADAGDTLIGFHASFYPGSLTDIITASLTAPTGDRSKGLGAGQVTYDFNNHTERYYNRLGFLVDLGIGNSSGLFNDLVVQDYTSVGTLAHFQAGAVFWLPRRTYIEAVAYEQLPLGSQTVYRAVQRGEDVRANDDDGGGNNPNPPPPVAVTVSTASEDNGFTTFVGIPLVDHITLSGYYNRSLRQRLDTVSVGVTFVLRSKPSKRSMSMIDRALREAEGSGH